jgi:hypothetical protein
MIPAFCSPDQRRYSYGLRNTVWLMVALASAMTLGVSSPSPEPVYAGKTITEWLNGGYEPAALALQEIGPSSVPWIFRALRNDRPTINYGAGYAKIRQHLPSCLVRMFPYPRTSKFDELRAANLLIGMGPPVRPALRAGLADSNPAVRSACWMALNGFEPKKATVPQRLP